MVELFTRILPIIIVLALALIFGLRFAMWVIDSRKKRNPPDDTGQPLDTGNHSHHG